MTVRFWRGKPRSRPKRAANIFLGALTGHVAIDVPFLVEPSAPTPGEIERRVALVVVMFLDLPAGMKVTEPDGRFTGSAVDRPTPQSRVAEWRNATRCSVRRVACGRRT